MAEEIIVFSEEELKLLKQSLAKKLYAAKHSQSEIAKILKLTQPMVSNYLSSKDRAPGRISELADKVVDKIRSDIPIDFYSIVAFSEKKINGCSLIADPSEIMTDDKKEVKDNLNSAFDLLKGLDVEDFAPEVKMNMVMAKRHPKTIQDIASFTNGILMRDGKINSINDVHFGTSNHLANLLLYVKSRNQSINAMMNIKFNNRLLRTRLNCSYLTKDYRIKGSITNTDILIHRGDFGIEPCAYILGMDAVETAKKVIRLMKEV